MLGEVSFSQSGHPPAKKASASRILSNGQSWLENSEPHICRGFPGWRRVQKTPRLKLSIICELGLMISFFLFSMQNGWVSLVTSPQDSCSWGSVSSAVPQVVFRTQWVVFGAKSPQGNNVVLCKSTQKYHNVCTAHKPKEDMSKLEDYVLVWHSLMTVTFIL